LTLWQALNSTEGLADRVSLRFNPIAFTKKRFGNGTSICPLPNEPVDGRIVDTDCDVDKFETCLVRTEYCGTASCRGRKELALAHFLGCFEGLNAANFSALDKCAEVSGIDLTAAKRCNSNSSERERLWQQQLAMKERSTLQFFPTVLLDNELSDSSKSFVQDVCDRLAAPKPKGCPKAPPAPPTPPADPCSGHRCDQAACPCGCECGNDKDPGLCYVPAYVPTDTANCSL